MELWLSVIKSYHYGSLLRGYENDFLSVKPMSLPQWPQCYHWDVMERGKQMCLLSSPPSSNRTEWITQQWRDKWRQYQASLPRMEQFTWKQPSDQNLIFSVVMLFWYCLQRRHLRVTSPGCHSPARNPTVDMSSCESQGIFYFLFFIISQQQSSLLFLLNRSAVSSW